MKRSVAKTAAASVDATTAPSISDVTYERSKRAYAATLVTRADTSTPTVLSSAAGSSTGRTARHGVVSPPSKRMIVRPITPSVRARCGSSKSMPPGPSEPSSIPSARNPISTGTPRRVAARAAATAPTSTAPTINNSVPGSSGGLL